MNKKHKWGGYDELPKWRYEFGFTHPIVKCSECGRTMTVDEFVSGKCVGDKHMKFKVGDKVKVKPRALIRTFWFGDYGPTRPAGENLSGEITGIRNDQTVTICCKDYNNRYDVLLSDLIELEKPVDNPMKFKIGDKVVCVRDDNGWRGLSLGSVYTVTEVDKDSTLKVSGIDLNPWLAFSRFELHKEEPKEKRMKLEIYDDSKKNEPQPARLKLVDFYGDGSVSVAVVAESGEPLSLIASFHPNRKLYRHESVLPIGFDLDEKGRIKLEE